jgi:hypothetical protein
LQDVNSLQYEAEQLATKAATEKAEVLGELDRLHKLVASFQAQIREVSSTPAAHRIECYRNVMWWTDFASCLCLQQCGQRWGLVQVLVLFLQAPTGGALSDTDQRGEHIAVLPRVAVAVHLLAALEQQNTQQHLA